MRRYHFVARMRGLKIDLYQDADSWTEAVWMAKQEMDSILLEYQTTGAALEEFALVGSKPV